MFHRTAVRGFTALATVVAASAVGTALPPTEAEAAVSCARVASPSGSDTNSGTLSSPFRTPQKLADSLASGETGCLRGGSYSGSFDIRRSNVTLRSYPGERATVTVGTARVLDGANYVTVSDLNLVGTKSLTLRWYGDNGTFQNNDLTNNYVGTTCLIVGGSSTTTNYLTVRRNRIHHCGQRNSNLDHGIYAANFRDMTVTDNVFYETAAYAIQLYPNGMRARVAHNVIDGGGDSIRGGIIIDGSTAQGHLIENNIVAHSSSQPVIARTGSGHVVRNNCFYATRSPSLATATASGNLTADPRFVNRTARDYRLGSGTGCLPLVGYDTAASLLESPTTAPATSTAPAVSLTAPAEGTKFRNSLRLTASATDDKSIAKVEFYLDGKLIVTERILPYDRTWSVPSGLSYSNHKLMAKAYDGDGQTATSQTVTITRVR